MILEYEIDFRSSSLIYEKIFLKVVDNFGLSGKILREGNILKLYIEADDADMLENFATTFAKRLPNSIFLYNTTAKIVEELPETNIDIADEKLSLPFCLDCLSDVSDEGNPHYHDIFHSCEVCGYGVSGENKSYKSEFEELAKKIADKKTIKLNSFYGTFIVGIDENVFKSVDFDVVAFDTATLQKYTHATKEELNSLGSFEKPLVKLKTTLKFKTAHESISRELIRFKLSDDFIFHFLMQELKALDIELLFVTREDISFDEDFSLFQEQTYIEPIEIVASQNQRAIIRGEKGLPKFDLSKKDVVPAIGAFESVKKENNLTYENIVAVYLSKKYQNNILLYGEKFGLVEYLNLNFEFSSVKDIFEEIQNSSDTAEKLIQNYQNKFSEHFEKIKDITFENKNMTIYNFWGVVAVIADLYDGVDIDKASQKLEENTLLFLGDRGPRIDYKTKKIDNKTYLDPLLVIRSAISFKLAGVDPLTLSFGIMESFAEFIVSEVDNLKESMNIEAICFSGSLFENNKFFKKITQDTGKNHKMYFNNELLVDGKNIFLK